MSLPLLIAVTATLGCTQLDTHEPVQTGPRARLTFASPYLEDRFLAIDGLHLEISDADTACRFVTRGRLALSGNTKTATTYVSANRRAYFSVWQGSTGMLGESYSRMDFSFVPEDGAEYRIEHIDNPARLRVQFLTVNADGSTRPFEVQDHTCTAP
ncbi:MAG: hypothetical protein IT486_12725 [Gammaproteobacteria bacterium]|nr:hypothetical protein [Gammaproteobacteria bacterium]